jgi:cell shape-determining protein MreC
MVRALAVVPQFVPRASAGWAIDSFSPFRCRHAALLLLLGLLAASTGCAIVPRSRMEECQRMTQTLRSENARAKDRVLALQAQNRDYAERAVDDARRLATQDEAIERLEHSVQAYQDERARLEAAYKQLASNLGSTESPADGSPSAASSISATRDAAAAGTSRRSKGRTGEDDAAPPR